MEDTQIRQDVRSPAKADCRKLLIVGCGRSGTTWLKLLLAQHRDVVTTGETRLFSAYLGKLDQAWRQDQAITDNTGLKPILSEDDFNGLCRGFAERVFDRITAANPRAEVMVEKTPWHVFHVGLIHKLLPDAYFLNIVRDPRGVVGSLRAASRSFGRGWAPRSVAAGARMWRDSIRSARAIQALTDRYKEVRYEDLLGERGPSILDELYQWLDLHTSPALSNRIFESCGIENLRKADSGVKENRTRPDTRQAFFRKGRADSWRQELSNGDIRIIEYMVGDLMSLYGYAPVLSGGGNRRGKPARLFLYDALEGLEWRSNRTVAAMFAHARSLT